MVLGELPPIGRLGKLFSINGYRTRSSQSAPDYRKFKQELMLGQIGSLELVPFVSSDRRANNNGVVNGS